MTKDEVITLGDAFRYDGERCTETLIDAFDHVRKVWPEKPAAQQVIFLHRALMKTYAEHPESLFGLMNAVIGKFLVPELTAKEQYSIRMYSLRSKDNE